ncbi:DUF937 domain-containing protein [Spirosoma spitsbergense]|jgi:OOP family OmpA-OmpF porin|uniref:DUF937 domain-containing protein n=1 Tax=Spirosoma spitsbergense TaxID=431554 RepID=UPI000372FB77|nr:DUF937 domain-containing protein [Spirosoma spitsbergense]
MNLFANITHILSSDILARIAVYIDEPAEKSEKAVQALVYTVMGGLMRRTTSEIGVNQLYNHIQKGRYDGTLIENLATVLQDPAQTNTLITQGNNVVSHLLPAMKSSIGSMISTYAGIRNSSAISLLGLITTLVLHVLGKQAKDQKLDADALAASLFGERDTLVNDVPEDFMPQLVEKVGLQQIVTGLAVPARRTVVESPGRSTTATIRPPVTYEPTDEADGGNETLTKWGVGALIAVAISIGGYFLYQNTQKYSDKQEGATEVTTVENDTIQADTVTRSLAVPKEPVVQPKSVSVTAPASTIPAATVASAGNLSQQMTPYLGNAALPKGRVFPLAGVTFQPGSLSLTATSQPAINELATLLKTYPQLQIQLIGYANDAQAGFTNKSLSFKRVNQIKQQLVNTGINYLRIDAIGRGTGVSRLDTSGAPKPTLRKIDLKVVTK